MRKFILFFCMMLMTFGLIMEAHAKRFGGGKSFGLSRTHSSYSSHSYSNNRNRAHAMGNRKSLSLGSFLRPIGGFILGGLLASLLMGHGFGTGILTWLALIAGVFLILQFFRSKFPQSQQQPLTSPVQFESVQTNPNSNRYKPYSNNVVNMVSFDIPGFLTQAKALFGRLQQAYNDKNLADISQFTTQEVYAEIRSQIQEMGNADNYIEILKLESEFINSETVMRETIASVRFSGLIKEAINDPARSFVEIWHFRREQCELPWKVAGIEQETA